jgi:hypothetical protein
VSKPEIPVPEDDDETTFDVDRWLLEARPPQRAVVVYGRGDLLSSLEALNAEPQPAGVTMGQSQRQKDMAYLREQIEDSRRVLHVRALLEAERAEIGAKYQTPPEQKGDEPGFDQVGYENEAYSLAIVSPVMTVEQVKRMHAAIGEAQWAAIGSAVNKASTETIDIPLSRLGSGTTGDS